EVDVAGTDEVEAVDVEERNGTGGAAGEFLLHAEARLLDLGRVIVRRKSGNVAGQVAEEIRWRRANVCGGCARCERGWVRGEELDSLGQEFAVLRLDVIEDEIE